MTEALIRARGLSRDYLAPRTRGFGRAERTPGLVDVDLTVTAGSAVGIIGESGSGKSTLVRLLLGLDVPRAGTVEVDGRAVDGRGSARSLHWLRRATGIVFQDPYASLDPRMNVERIVGEPLWALGIEGDRRARVREVLEQVGLDADAERGSRTSSRADSVSASPSRGRSCTARASSSATSRCRRSTSPSGRRSCG